MGAETGEDDHHCESLLPFGERWLSTPVHPPREREQQHKEEQNGDIREMSTYHGTTIAGFRFRPISLNTLACGNRDK